MLKSKSKYNWDHPQMPEWVKWIATNNKKSYGFIHRPIKNKETGIWEKRYPTEDAKMELPFLDPCSGDTLEGRYETV